MATGQIIAVDDLRPALNTLQFLFTAGDWVCFQGSPLILAGWMVGAKPLIEGVDQDFQERQAGYRKSRREGLAALTRVMLEARSANLMEQAAALPREIATAEHRYQYIERQLKSAAIVPDDVIKPYAVEVIERLAAKGQTVALQMDQSRINDTNEVLMLSARVRKRALSAA